MAESKSEQLMHKLFWFTYGCFEWFFLMSWSIRLSLNLTLLVQIGFLKILKVWLWISLKIF